VSRAAHLRVIDRCEPGPGGCWQFTGATAGKGYGVVVTGSRADGTRRMDYAHRVVYAALVGPIPAGLHIDHLCRVPRCVNPDHLEAVTPRENVMRGEHPAVVASRANVCLRGLHPLEDAYIKSDGRRECRACRAETQATRYQRDKAEAERLGLGIRAFLIQRASKGAA
jgi:hypothetical protein